MPLIVLRFVFVMVAAGLGFQLIQSDLLAQDPWYLPWVGFGECCCWRPPSWRRHVRAPQGPGYGLGRVRGLARWPVPDLRAAACAEPDLAREVRAHFLVLLVLGMVLCYTCISLLLQTKDDFRFIIPYVEFVKEIKGLKPYVLDTSVVIGRPHRRCRGDQRFSTTS